MPVRAPLPKWPTLNLEREFGGRVCGVDEAGYAPIAGPIVAAAVVLPPGPKPRRLRGLTDSKLLQADRREHFHDVILDMADVGIGMASIEEIDRHNIYKADMLAMQRAVEDLGSAPDAALVDGRGAPPIAGTVKTVIKGDRRSLSIAAASVMAKVTRDRLMSRLAGEHPEYGWDRNAGYGTAEHYLALLRHGVTRHHRRSFAPLNTIFAADALPFGDYRFGPIADPPDTTRLDVLELRRDLHAVFDANGWHIGEIRSLRGRWTFHATGYSEDSEPISGAGPCAGCHGERLDAPGRGALEDLLAKSPI